MVARRLQTDAQEKNDMTYTWKPTSTGRPPYPAHHRTGMPLRWSEWLLFAGAILAFLILSCIVGIAQTNVQTNAYQQTNLVSDGTVTAQQTDPTLINPWGIAIGQQTPFWVNEAGSGFSVVYGTTGAKQFAVTVPTKKGGTGAGLPSGIVFNAPVPAPPARSGCS
jgi:hypothetical protein